MQLTSTYYHLLIQKDKLILEMEDYAKENHVPIMDRLGMEFMLQFLRLIGPKSILRAWYSNWLF